MKQTYVNTRLATAVFWIVLLVFSLVPVAFTVARGVPEGEAGSFVEPLQIVAPATVSTVPLMELVRQFPESYSLEFFTDHPQALARLIQGEVDLLATGFSVGFSRYQAAGDVVHLFTPVWGVSAIMTGEQVHSLRDISPPIITAPFEGSPIDIFVRTIIEAEGLTGEIDVDYVPFPQAAALLGQGSVGAAVLVEPIASRLESAGNAYRLANLHDRWAEITGGEPRSPQVSLFAMRPRAAARAEAHSQMEARLSKIIAELIADPAPFAAAHSAALDVPTAILERALENTLFSMPDHTTVVELIAAYSLSMGLAEPESQLFEP